MRKRSLLLGAALASRSLAGPDLPLFDYHAHPGRNGEFEIHRDLEYGVGAVRSGAATKTLLADAFIPEGLDGFRKAAILFIHGGGFVSGSRRDYHDECIYFARKGFVTFTIDYRKLADNPPYAPGVAEEVPHAPAAVVDAKAALRWVHSRAREMGIDPGNIFVAGTSAGAITALAAGVTGPAEFTTDLPGQSIRPENSPGAPSNVQGIIDNCGGLYNLVDSIDSGDPPILIHHGTLDDVVPFPQALALRDRCLEVGLAHEFHPIAGGGHCPTRPAANGKTLRQLTHEFILRNLGSGGPSRNQKGGS